MLSQIVLVSTIFSFVLPLCRTFEWNITTVKPKNKVVNYLSSGCVKNISQLNLECTKNVDLKWTAIEAKDPEYLSAQVRCCSTWDTVDCVIESVKQKCHGNLFDKYIVNTHLKDLQKHQKSLGCGRFYYHSKQCGYILKNGEEEPTTVEDYDVEIEINSTTKQPVIIRPSKLPFTENCQRSFSRIGIECREEVFKKHHSNNTMIYMTQNKYIDEESGDDLCCLGWESINCIRDGVKGNCNKTEIVHFLNITGTDLRKICPGPEKCNFTENCPTSSHTNAAFLYFWGFIAIVIKVILS